MSLKGDQLLIDRLGKEDMGFIRNPNHGNGGERLMNLEQARGRARHHDEILITPTTSGQTITFGGSVLTTDFEIPSQTHMEKAEHMLLKFRSNVTSAPVDAVPFPLAVERIEIRAGGSDKILQTISKYQLWLNYGYINEEQLSALLAGDQLNMGTNYQSTGLMAVGSRNNELSIFGCLLSMVRLRAFGNAKVIVRVVWNTSIAVNGTLNANITFTNLELLIHSEEVEASEHMNYLDLLKKAPLEIHYPEVVVQEFSSVTLNASTRSSQFELTSIQGWFPILKALIQKSSNANPSVLTAISPVTVGSSTDNGNGKIELMDKETKQFLSTNGFSDRQVRYAYSALHMPSKIHLHLPVYDIPLAETPAAFVLKGAVDGYAYFNGKEKIHITPSANWTNGTDYTVVVVGYRLKKLTIDRTGGDTPYIEVSDY